MLKKHHIAFELLYSKVWEFILICVEVIWGSVKASWLSWSRLGVILGRLDTILDVLEFCVIWPHSWANKPLLGPNMAPNRPENTPNSTQQ